MLFKYGKTWYNQNMQNSIFLGNDLYYVGGNDRRIALFENSFPVPRGVSYNSYLLKDEKTALFDTVDHAISELFFENVEAVLGGRKLDYLIVQHMEPDHSASFAGVIGRYPGVKVVCNKKTAAMLKNFGAGSGYEVLEVEEGAELSTGKHKLKFVFAPMVHWPEVMFTFDGTTGTLFSADAFGTFGALPGHIYADELHFERDFLNDARRYYFNIVGKYGIQVTNVIKKAAGLDIKLVCPLHGPIWRKDFAKYLNYYRTWSAYEPEEKGVAVFYGSVYGHTQNAAEILAAKLAEAGIENIAVYDVAATHGSKLLSEAFRYSHAVFACATLNNGIFGAMEHFLSDLTAHFYQNRTAAFIENGSWAPQAGKLMQEKLSACKNMRTLGETVKILSAPTEETAAQLDSLAKTIAADLK